MAQGALKTTQPADNNKALRTPPHNYEAERALLGAILMNNRAYERVSDFLAADHFADPVNGRIYEAIVKLINQGVQANPVTLKNFLEKDELIAHAGGMKYIAALAAGAVTVVNAGDYGHLIEDMWRRRELIEMAENLANMAYFPDPDTSAADILQAHEAALTGLTDRGKQDEVVLLAQALNDTIAHWELSSREGEVGLSYGMPSLDWRAGLLQDEEFIVIGARPSMGKTALVRRVARNAASAFLAASIETQEPPKSVLFFSAEMGLKAQAGAVLTGLTGIPRPRKKDALSNMDVSELVVKAGEVANLPLYIDATPAVTLSHMRTACRRMQRRPGGLGLVIVDYLQLMGIERGVRLDGPVQKVTYLSQGLKELARTLKVPVIALSQLSRAVEQRENKRPQLADLRESGAIEQDADVIMFLYRDEYYLERDPPQKRDSEGLEQFNKRSLEHGDRLEKARGKAEVIVAKARLGSIGTAILNFDGPRMDFSDPRSGGVADGPPPGHPAAQSSFDLGGDQ